MSRVQTTSTAAKCTAVKQKSFFEQNKNKIVAMAVVAILAAVAVYTAHRNDANIAKIDSSTNYVNYVYDHSGSMEQAGVDRK